MADISKIKIPGTDEVLNIKDVIARDMLLDVTQYGVDNTGTTDITDTVNQIIADHPHSTLYFKAGEYEIDGTIILPSSNAKRVHILADKSAYFRKTLASDTTDSMFQVGDNWDDYDRQGDRPLTFIEGGVYNGYRFNQVFKIWKIQCVYLQNFTIISAQNRGIYLANHMTGAFSCNAYIQNGKIHGMDGLTTNDGILNDSYDNSFSHLMIDGFRIGVSNTGGGGVYDDVHVLGIYYPTATAEDFNQRTGFYMPNDCRLVNCYADCVGLGFGISASVHAINTFYYNYWNVDGMTPRAFSYSTSSVDSGQAIFENVTIGCVDGIKTTLLENNLNESAYPNGFTPIFKNVRLINAKINSTSGSNVNRLDEMFKLSHQGEYRFSPIGNNTLKLPNGQRRTLAIVNRGRAIQNFKCLLNGGYIDIDFVAFDGDSIRVYRDDSVLESDIIVEFRKYGDNIAITITNQYAGDDYLVCCDGIYFSSASNDVSLYSYPFEWMQNSNVDSNGEVLYTIHAYRDVRPMYLETAQGVQALTFTVRGFTTGNNGVILFTGDNNNDSGVVFTIIGLHNGIADVKHLGTSEPDVSIDYSDVTGFYTVNVTNLAEYTIYTVQTLTNNLFIPH